MLAPSERALLNHPPQSDKTPKRSNLPASVRQRLLNRACPEGRPFNELLQYYGCANCRNAEPST